MSELHTACLWLEFGGQDDERRISNPYSWIRFVETRIEGGDGRELIGSRDPDGWRLAYRGELHYSRISGLGVFCVHLELLDGSDVSLDCTRVTIDGPLLLVDGQAVARFDEARGTWTQLGTDSRLNGIRLEPEGTGNLDVLPPQHDGYGGGYSHA